MKGTPTNTEVVINLTHEALHCWPNAFEAVDYLKNKHRHNFHIRMKKRVFHDDRDIEFIHWKHQVQKYLSSLPYDMGATSCEMLARDLFERFECTCVEVNEDGEAGAIIQTDTTLHLKMAWLAGILDSGAHIMSYGTTSNDEKKRHMSFTICIFNTDKAMIDVIVSILAEVGIVAYPTTNPVIRQDGHVYGVCINHPAEIIKVLNLVLPFLVTQKKQAEMAIDWCNTMLTTTPADKNSDSGKKSTATDKLELDQMVEVCDGGYLRVVDINRLVDTPHVQQQIQNIEKLEKLMRSKPKKKKKKK